MTLDLKLFRERCEKGYGDLDQKTVLALIDRLEAAELEIAKHGDEYDDLNAKLGDANQIRARQAKEIEALKDARRAALKEARAIVRECQPKYGSDIRAHAEHAVCSDIIEALDELLEKK